MRTLSLPLPSVVQLHISVSFTFPPSHLQHTTSLTPVKQSVSQSNQSSQSSHSVSHPEKYTTIKNITSFATEEKKKYFSETDDLKKKHFGDYLELKKVLDLSRKRQRKTDSCKNIFSELLELRKKSISVCIFVKEDNGWRWWW